MRNAFVLALGLTCSLARAQGRPIQESGPKLSDRARAMLVMDLAKRVALDVPPVLDQIDRTHLWDVCKWGRWKDPKVAEPAIRTLLRDNGILLRYGSRLVDGLPTGRLNDMLIYLAQLQEGLSGELTAIQNGNHRRAELCRIYSDQAAAQLAAPAIRLLTQAEIDSLDALESGDNPPMSDRFKELESYFYPPKTFDAAAAQAELDLYLKAPTLDEPPAGPRKTRSERERDENEAAAREDMAEQNRQAAERFHKAMKEQKETLTSKGVVSLRSRFYECGRQDPPMRNDDPRLAGFIQDGTCKPFDEPIALVPEGLP